MCEKKILSVLLIIIFCMPALAGIKEKDLARYRSAFISRVKRDNPGMGRHIQSCMDGIVRQGSAGVRVSDKFALFLYDSSRNRMKLERVRFFRQGSISAFMIIMKDLSDGQDYNLYLEYAWSGRDRSYSLKDIYFSMVFTEKMGAVKDFFGGD